MNILETRYELARPGRKPATRKGFCILSDRLAAKAPKLTARKRQKGEDFLEFDLKTPDWNITFFSEKGARAVNYQYLSAYPENQEPINLAHWAASVLLDGEWWRVRDIQAETTI